MAAKARSEETGAKVAEKLRFAREHAGWTLAAVRERTGIGESSLSEFENGKRAPSLSQLAQLASCYRRSLAFFFADALPSPEVVLWRQKPAEGARQELEAMLRRLSEQYHNLEVWCASTAPVQLPLIQVTPGSFGFRDAEELAKKVRRDLDLADRPAFALLRVLEEDCGVKVFHMDFEPRGSAACWFSAEHGAAILLNAKNSRWRRNYDLAHELFHLLTWEIFRPSAPAGSTKQEEKLANSFASHLVLPDEAVRTAVNRRLKDNRLPFDALFSIARDFDVSAEALLWRLHWLYRWDKDQTRERIRLANERARLYERRTQQDEPPIRPARFHALAVTALRRGEISLGRFAEYLGITRHEAKTYIEPDQTPDEEIELPPA